MSKKLVMFENAIQRLTRKQSYFSAFEDLEDWFFRAPDAEVDAEIKHLANIKEFVIDYYWARDIHISPSALDHIIFDVIKRSSTADAAKEVFKLVEKSGLHRRSVVIFPLHSFAFRYIGAQILLKTQRQFYLEHGNFRVLPQSNSFSKSKNAVLRYLDDISLPNRRKLDETLLDHFFRSRSLRWFEHNPLMLVNFRFSQWERFDNLSYIIEKVSFLAIKLYFIAALTHGKNATDNFSTGRVNNWETLDIHHFLTITTLMASCTANCLPVHAKRSMVFDFTNMNVDLDLKGTLDQKWVRHALATIDKLHQGWAAFRRSGAKSYKKFYRFASALKQFRRSYQAYSDSDRVIFIQTAFETLLIDTMTSNKREAMLRRSWLAMRGSKYRKSEIERILGDLVDDRNDIIHAGEQPTRVKDFQVVYELFCRLLIRLADDLGTINSGESEYMSAYFKRL